MTSHVELLQEQHGPSALRRWVDDHSIRRYSDQLWVAVAVVATLSLTVVIVAWPRHVPVITLAPLIVFAGFHVPTRRLWLIYAPVALVVLVIVPLANYTPIRSVVVDVCVAALMIMMFLVAHARDEAGITGFTGEGFLVDLRDRLIRGAEMPVLPAPWVAEYRVHPAFGEAFSGDFLVAASHDQRLEIALVDVSGKGKQAGSRSLALSGALGGILGSVDPERFLEAANAYLLRQGWDEGFATAVHVEVDLRTGRGSVGRAGHPPAVVYREGAGAWQTVHGAGGAILGVVADLSFPREPLALQMGDVLMVYSDGVIESRGHELSEGFDRMLGAASRALLRGGSVAEEVCGSARAGHADDRAAFVLHRG